ncbi:hypothetical protein K1T71_003659 [Dendrolimus kikuchii]|uniref:Uncharacterized protein n=1 Tax=Dendrolimus kikuchii TaxID=765133 RepID=A0ACC1D8S1_9NEOP|nr:hypothetical protein K1T71_003659 [Dendrolimus kikuchii]
MFIALKWLVGMAIAMWVAMCSLDFYFKRRKEVDLEDVLDFNIKPFDLYFKNLSKANIVEQKSRVNDIKAAKEQQTMVWQCVMFGAGALVVSLYNRKKEIISYMKSSLNYKLILVKIWRYFKLTAIFFNVAMLKYLKTLLVKLKKKILKLKMFLRYVSRPQESLNRAINLSLLQKLKEISMERKKLGQLLIAAIHENKNICTQYQLESMAKTRLVQHIEETQKQIKDNKTRYISFQQLYLVTSQENMFLKSRITKLTKEKENAEKNLMELLKEVFKSKDKDLKAYCSRFVVKTRENLLNSDVNSEIEKFLHKCKSPATTKSVWQFSRQSGVEISTTRSWPRYGNGLVSDILQEDCLVPLVSDAPKLKGLPGECIWTVKDKDGIIEKLYEYDYESDFDNGDTIRRIREYSVYHDKDCLLDFSSSRTLVHSASSIETLRNQYWNANNSISTERFLTDSSAFKNFMQSNKNIVMRASHPH